MTYLTANLSLHQLRINLLVLSAACCSSLLMHMCISHYLSTVNLQHPDTLENLVIVKKDHPLPRQPREYVCLNILLERRKQMALTSDSITARCHFPEDQSHGVHICLFEGLHVLQVHPGLQNLRGHISCCANLQERRLGRAHELKLQFMFWIPLWFNFSFLRNSAIWHVSKNSGYTWHKAAFSAARGIWHCPDYQLSCISLGEEKKYSPF